MTVWTAIASAYRSYWTTRGRASRTEYFAFLFHTLGITAALFLLDYALIGDRARDATPLSAAFLIFASTPLSTVFVRRLHDTGETMVFPYVALWGFVPMILGLAQSWTLATLLGLVFVPLFQLIYVRLLMEAPTFGSNQYGAEPGTRESDVWHEHQKYLRRQKRRRLVR